MGNAVFIADFGTRYGRKIADTFMANSYQVIRTAARTAESDDELPNGISKSIFAEIEWNTVSPFFTRNVILNLHRHENIKYHIIVFSTPEEEVPLYRQTQPEIQKSLDAYLRSGILLAKDLINDLSKKENASLFFVLDSNSNHPYKDFFKAFISSILQDTQKPGMVINAFETGKETHDVFAEYVYSLIIDKGNRVSGKWFRQFQMQSLFGGLSIPGVR